MCVSDAAEVDVLEGVLVANADEIGGFAIWVDDQVMLRHSGSFLGVDRAYHDTAPYCITGTVSQVVFDLVRVHREDDHDETGEEQRWVKQSAPFSDMRWVSQ